MSKTTGIPIGLNFTPFSDGYDDGFNKLTDDAQHFWSEMGTRGSQGLKDIILASSTNGRPVTCLVYSTLLPWASRVAREMHLPSALLWIQPAAVFDIYYYYFHGYKEVIETGSNDPSCNIVLPGLPPLTSRDLPSFLLPSSPNTYSFALLSFKEHMDMLDVESKPVVLVNTFDTLEAEALKAVNQLNLIAIGPLIPPASDSSFRVDLFQKSRNYIEWLNSKEEGSVVYVSFGSMLELPKKQMEEIARGLLTSSRPFLWVVRQKEGGGEEKEDQEKLSCMEELEQQGMIVPWCSQLEVLSHPSLGCFVTHCGWNSTLESLIYGVPVVAFPQWTDQGTNAKLIEEVWRTGVRVMGNCKEEGLVDGEEVRRCIEMVMGRSDERGEEMRRNAKKWKDLGREAMKEGGSSEKNLKSFVDQVGDFSLGRV